MTLKKYIKHCKALLAEHGNITNFYSSGGMHGDHVLGGYAPEVMWLSDDEPISRSGRVENLIPLQGEDESDEDWIDEHCIDIELDDDGKYDREEFEKTHKKVVLL